MQPEFWHERWKKKEIGFHASFPHPLLVQYFSALALAPDSRVFLPLCGKTLDIGWLLSHGYRVAGAELSEPAVRQLFAELDIEPTITADEKLNRFSGPNLDIFVGNIFDLHTHQLGTVDAIYDRAALVALPFEMRARYANHLSEVTRNAPQLLICFKYEQPLMPGPPFSVPESEVRDHYAKSYALQQLASVELQGGLRGKIPALEQVWLLKRIITEGQ